MNDQARKLLAFVIHHYGVDVIQTPKQLQALLKNHAKGQFKPEISLFMQAVTEGLVVKLLTHQYASVQALSARAIKHLQEDCFIEKQAAHWVIDSWCIALKLARPIPIHTTPAPVAQAKPSPVAVIKSPVPLPTPTVQATPVPVIQGTSVLYKIMKLLSYLSLFYLLVVVPVAILSKQDKTPAGVGTQEDSARKPRTTLNWHDGDSFTIGGDSDEQMRQSAGVAAQEDSDEKPRTAIGAEQTQDAILISEALGAVPATSTGTDTFGREVDIVETDAGNPIALTQITQFGVKPSGYQTTLLSPYIPQYQKDLFRKTRPHKPASDLYTPEGKPSDKLLEGIRRVQLLNKATAIYKEGNTTEAGLSPAEAYRKNHNELFDADPNLYMDGWAYLNGKHAVRDALPTSVPAPLEPLPKDPRGLIEQILTAP